jgi:hypothetical protein
MREVEGGRGRGCDIEMREKGGGAHESKIIFSHGFQRFMNGKSHGVSNNKEPKMK